MGLKITKKYTDALARQSISETITGIDYNNTTGVFSLTSGYVIPTTTDESNWDTAYGWGDHAGLYDLVGAGASAVGTHESTYNHSNYNTAYGWGDHASGGYLKANGTVALTASWDAGGYEIRAQTFYSDVATGTAPLQITSTTLVNNLNANYLGGIAESAFWLISGRTGGQTAYGGKASGDDMTLISTTDATKGSIFLNDSTVVVNNNGGDYDFYVKGNTDDNLFNVNAGVDKISIGSTENLGKFGVFTTANDEVAIFGRKTYTGIASDVGIAMQVQFLDHRTTQNISNQCLRFEYVKYGDATVNPSVYDVAVAVVTSFYANESSWISYIAATPYIDTGVTLDSYQGIRIEQCYGDGAVTAQYGLYFSNFDKGATYNYSIYTNTGYVHFGDRVGINLDAPLAQLHIDQSSTTGAIPVLTLDQADVSEEFINFVGTVGAGNSIDTAAVGTYYGKVRVQVEGVGYKYMALYDS